MANASRSREVSFVPDESMTRTRRTANATASPMPGILHCARNFNPSETAMLLKVANTVSKICRMHGAEEIQTPVFDSKETLAGKYGETSDLCDTINRNGELLMLRYDLTVPFARYLAVNKIQSMKSYQMGKVHRAERSSGLTPSSFRDFIQCDFDIAGFASMMPDAECLRILSEILMNLSIGGFCIRVNHRKLLTSILTVCGIPLSKHRTMLKSLSSLSSVTWDDIRDKLMHIEGLSDDIVSRLGEFVKMRGQRNLIDHLRKHADLIKVESAQKALKEMDLLMDYCDSYDVLKYVCFDLSVARELDYYTDLVFEARLVELMKGAESIGSIAGGGRYDNLVTLFDPKSRPVPCVGFSVDIERIVAIMVARSKLLPQSSNERTVATDVLVSAAHKSLLEERMKLSASLWDAGINAETSNLKYTRIFLEQQYCEDRWIPYIVIISEQKLREGLVTVKNVESREAEVVKRDELVVHLRSLLKTSDSGSGTRQKSVAAADVASSSRLKPPTAEVIKQVLVSGSSEPTTPILQMVTADNDAVRTDEQHDDNQRAFISAPWQASSAVLPQQQLPAAWYPRNVLDFGNEEDSYRSVVKTSQIYMPMYKRYHGKYREKYCKNNTDDASNIPKHGKTRNTEHYGGSSFEGNLTARETTTQRQLKTGGAHACVRSAAASNPKQPLKVCNINFMPSEIPVSARTPDLLDVPMTTTSKKRAAENVLDVPRNPRGRPPKRPKTSLDLVIAAAEKPVKPPTSVVGQQVAVDEIVEAEDFINIARTYLEDAVTQPRSFLAQVDIMPLLQEKNFSRLPAELRQAMIALLPPCDRVVLGAKLTMRTAEAISNCLRNSALAGKPVDITSDPEVARLFDHDAPLLDMSVEQREEARVEFLNLMLCNIVLGDEDVKGNGVDDADDGSTNEIYSLRRGALSCPDLMTAVNDYKKLLQSGALCDPLKSQLREKARRDYAEMDPWKRRNYEAYWGERDGWPRPTEAAVLNADAVQMRLLAQMPLEQRQAMVRSWREKNPKILTKAVQKSRANAVVKCATAIAEPPASSIVPVVSDLVEDEDYAETPDSSPPPPMSTSDSMPLPEQSEADAAPLSAPEILADGNLQSVSPSLPHNDISVEAEQAENVLHACDTAADATVEKMLIESEDIQQQADDSITFSDEQRPASPIILQPRSLSAGVMQLLSLPPETNHVAETADSVDASVSDAKLTSPVAGTAASVSNCANDEILNAGDNIPASHVQEEEAVVREEELVVVAPLHEAEVIAADVGHEVPRSIHENSDYADILAVASSHGDPEAKELLAKLKKMSKQRRQKAVNIWNGRKKSRVSNRSSNQQQHDLLQMSSPPQPFVDQNAEAPPEVAAPLCAPLNESADGFHQQPLIMGEDEPQYALSNSVKIIAVVELDENDEEMKSVSQTEPVVDTSNIAGANLALPTDEDEIRIDNGVDSQLLNVDGGDHIPAVPMQEELLAVVAPLKESVKHELVPPDVEKANMPPAAVSEGEEQGQQPAEKAKKRRRRVKNNNWNGKRKSRASHKLPKQFLDNDSADATAEAAQVSHVDDQATVNFLQQLPVTGTKHEHAFACTTEAIEVEKNADADEDTASFCDGRQSAAASVVFSPPSSGEDVHSSLDPSKSAATTIALAVAEPGVGLSGDSNLGVFSNGDGSAPITGNFRAGEFFSVARDDDVTESEDEVEIGTCKSLRVGLRSGVKRQSTPFAGVDMNDADVIAAATVLTMSSQAQRPPRQAQQVEEASQPKKRRRKSKPLYPLKRGRTVKKHVRIPPPESIQTGVPAVLSPPQSHFLPSNIVHQQEAYAQFPPGARVCTCASFFGQKCQLH